MPISIVDYENLIKDPLSLGLFRNLLRMNSIMKLFPIVQKKTLRVTGQEWDELPSVAFRDLNEQYTDSTGTTKPAEERQAILGGSFKADKLLKELQDTMYRDPVQQQFDMYNVSIDRTLTDYVFNGDIDSNPKAFNGLYKRFGLAGGFPSASAIDMESGGVSFHVLASAANSVSFFEKLDEAMYACGLWGSGTDRTPQGALFLNKKSFLGIQKAAKLTGYSIDQIDLLGYTWKSYMGIPMVDVGLKVDKATEIIGNTYGTDSHASRIYCCRFSAPDGEIDSPGADGLSLLQASPYKALGPEDYAEYQRWAVQWVLGMVHIGDSYCASLLKGFEMAAA